MLGKVFRLALCGRLVIAPIAVQITADPSPTATLVARVIEATALTRGKDTPIAATEGISPTDDVGDS